MIRGRHAFVLRAAWDRERARACALLLPGEHVDASRFGDLVRDVSAAHREVSHPHVPAVIAHNPLGDKPFVAFECAAVADGLTLLERLGAGPKVPYEGADGFIASLRSAMEAHHRGDDPRRCLGRLSLANVLFDARGGWHLVGLGRNFPTEDALGRPDASVPCFHAPEVGAGGAPSPVGDFIALRLLMRAMLTFVALPEPLARVLRGEAGPEADALVESLRWFEREVMTEVPAMRPSLNRIVEESERVRVLLRVRPSPERFAAHVAALLRADLEKSPTPTLVVGEQGALAVLPDGTALRFTNAAQRILLALARSHEGDPAAVTSVWSLVDAGWPGERVAPTSATNRVYVTLNRMRAAGLAPCLERVDGGYRLSPAVRVKVA